MLLSINITVIGIFIIEHDKKNFFIYNINSQNKSNISYANDNNNTKSKVIYSYQRLHFSSVELHCIQNCYQYI